MVPTRTYTLAPQTPPSTLQALDPLTQTLLHNRGITSADMAAAFLAPDYERDLHDPWLLTDMEAAVERVLRAIRTDERIVVFSDYDCDGIPGGVVLHDLLCMLDFKNFTNHIPHRHFDGFGLSVAAVEKAHADGARVLMTVDCGTADHAAVAAAHDLGIDVIITDHHEPEADLPSACAILNPKRDEQYPFRELCGAGVVYKFAQAVVARGKKAGVIDLKEGQEKWLLDMVGLATIADMVPLVGENRALAHYGLMVLRKSRRPGVQHLLRRARATQAALTEDDIGFTIAPRINAASRMDTPEDAFMMLATHDEAKAGAHVAHLEKLNNERKGLVASMTKEIKKRMETREAVPNVIVMGDPQWRPALVGLSANALAETYQRPTFLWGRDGNGVIKGSCRSDGRVSALHLMEHAREHFIEFGGHHASGGFSVSDEKIHTLAEVLAGAYSAVADEVMPEFHDMVVDAELSLEEVPRAYEQSVRPLAPFGMGNPKPLFRFVHVTPSRVEAFGKAREHTKLVFETAAGSLEAVTFFKQPEAFGLVTGTCTPLTLIAHIEESFFMNRRNVRLRIVDIL